MNQKDIARFWRKVSVGSEEDCWLWLGGTCRGYGVFSVRHISRYAHRTSYVIHRPQEDIRGLVVRHSCDNPSCVNPAHLSVGTQLDNMADRGAKGRTARGQLSGVAKLTDSLVREARELYRIGGFTQAELAMRCGVSASTMQAVLNGTTWRHVTARLKRSR